jgi:hypothetical protein
MPRCVSVVHAGRLGVVAFFAGLVGVIVATAGACASVSTGGGDPIPGASRVAFELIDNRIFVDVRINGQGPFKFAFDTGGANCITPELAATLRLDTVTGEGVSGAGENTVPSRTTHVAQFQVGDIVVADQSFRVIDFSPIKRAFDFRRFDGLFGFEFLERYVTTIAFDGSPDGRSGVLVFAERVDPAAVVGFDAVPFELVAQKPVIHGAINGVPARLLFDTGDRSGLTILTRFLEHPEIARAFAGSAVQTTGYGIGGPIPARLGRIDRLSWSPRAVLSNVIARQPVTKAGFNALTEIDASVGNEVMRQFTIVLDYRHRLAHFAPNARFGAATQFTPVPLPDVP